MTNRLAHILLSLLAVALTIVSCISDREVCTDSSQSDDKVQVKFTIAMDNAATSTRGSWTTDVPTETNATTYENTIDVNKLQVFFFGSDNKLLGEVKDLSYVRNTTSDNIYDILGNMELSPSQTGESQSYENCKIVVLANHTPITTAPTTIDGFSTLVETPNLENIKEGTDYIPMWGVKRYSSLTLTKGSCEDAGDIYMLRAMAKIEVSLGTDISKDYSLESVTLTKGNSKANLQPTLALVSTTTNADNTTTTSTNTYTTLSTFCSNLADGGGTNNLDTQACLNAVNNATTASDKTDIAFWASTESNESGKYILYVPEYKQETTPATISVKLKNLTKSTESSPVYEEYTMDLKIYDGNGEPTGDPLDLVRNNIYRYTITAVAPGTLTVVFTTSKWQQVVSQIGYDVQNGINADFVMYAWAVESDYDYPSANIKDATKGDREGAICFVMNPRYPDGSTSKLDNGNDTYNHTSGAAYYFKMTKPVGAVWRAVLTNNTEFKLNTTSKWVPDENSTDISYCSATGIAREKPYQIKVEARNIWYTPTSTTDWGELKNLTDAQKQEYGYTHGWYNTDGFSNQYNGKPDETIHYPYTDLYIEVSLDGVNFFKIPINPKNVKVLSSDNGGKTYYTDDRRFAVGKQDDDYHIRIWQLRADGTDYTVIAGNAISENTTYDTTIKSSKDTNDD